ncbi:uncharacterized protein NPIL_528391 [Nephila pilipes]|uniref:Uncharacterized protein n=1 Tax=Nephila pilipes TaxID=299642 RepID=A0A8X6R290_NEPPI|nr:uncharacterized protein NPIL_528391 [Nephila pilipes]
MNNQIIPIKVGFRVGLKPSENTIYFRSFLQNRNLKHHFENGLILFRLSKEISWKLIIDMVLCHFPVLPLWRICSIKVAIAISNDPEVKAVEKKYKIFDNISNRKGFHGFLTREDERCIMWRRGLPSQLHERDFPPIRRTVWQPKCYCARDITAEFEFIWRSKELKGEILHFDEWNNLVLEKISSLSIPAKYYRITLLVFVRYIRLEIKKWMLIHREILRCSEEPTNFHWKSSGKINYEETAKALIRNEKLDIRTRYALASFYYLKEDAVLLRSKERITWGEKSSISYNYFFLEVWNELKEGRDGIIDWDSLADNRTGFNSTGGDISLWPSHYRLGLRTLFTKLSRGKKLQWLIYSLEKETIDNEEFLFCLSHLEAHRENERLFREYPCQILGHFLDWPLQCKFLEVAERLWSFLSGRMFFFLIHFIIYQKILQNWNDCDYFLLLKEFWNRSPMHLKTCIELKNIFSVMMLVLNRDDTHSFYSERIVKYCEHIDFAFHFPRQFHVF